jgi:hypothetical protein
LRKYSFSTGWKRPGRAQLSHGAFVLLAPLGRRQIGPAQATRNDILAVVLQHAQKRFVGGDDGASEVPNADAQNVGVDQASDLAFAICEIATKPRILERDGCL